MLALGALEGKCVKCITDMTASWVLRFDTAHIVIDVDLFAVLSIVGEDLQCNRTVFAGQLSTFVDVVQHNSQ